MANLAPLDGLLVVDLTRAVAGPFCTMMLADLGARVIKVEEEAAGDETRNWGPPFVQGESTYFLSMNRNKESIALNLKQERGRRALHALAARADVLVENFRPGVAARLGAGYPELAAHKPDLIYASISGFGQTGPDRLKAGYDLIVQAMSGLMDSSAAPGGDPVKVSFPVSDILAALFTAQAILAALYSRAQTGRGRYIEVSLLEGMLCAMSALATGCLLTGKEPERVGTAQHNIVPYQLFRCQDAPIVAGAPNERLWERFCQALDQPQWLHQERFRGNAARHRHRQELVAEIEAVLARHPAAHWLGRLEEFEIPCGPVRSIGEALASPQIAARGFVAASEHPKLGPIHFPGNPMRLSDFSPPYQAPPAAGQHTAAILKEFGVSDD